MEQEFTHRFEENSKTQSLTIWLTRGSVDGKPYGRPSWYVILKREDNTNVIRVEGELTMFEYNILFRIVDWKKYMRFKFAIKSFFKFIRLPFTKHAG